MAETKDTATAVAENINCARREERRALCGWLQRLGIDKDGRFVAPWDDIVSRIMKGEHLK